MYTIIEESGQLTESQERQEQRVANQRLANMLWDYEAGMTLVELANKYGVFERLADNEVKMARIQRREAEDLKRRIESLHRKLFDLHASLDQVSVFLPESEI
jgi:hypothetical protein